MPSIRMHLNTGLLNIWYSEHKLKPLSCVTTVRYSDDNQKRYSKFGPFAIRKRFNHSNLILLVWLWVCQYYFHHSQKNCSVKIELLTLQ